MHPTVAASVSTMVRDFQSSDEGTTVRTQEGDEVGTIEKVEDKMARVTPDTGLSESIRNRLGWTSEDQDTYELDHSDVDQISDDEVRLKE